MAHVLKYTYVLLRTSLKKFMEDKCTRLAAAISYYGLFSLFPLFLAAVSIFGFIVKSPDLTDRLVNAVEDQIPVSRDLIRGTIEGVARARGTTGIVSIIGLLLSASAVFANVRESINQVWGITAQRHFVKQKLLDFGVIFTLGILLILSLLATAGIRFLRTLSSDLADSIFRNEQSIREGLAKLFPPSVAERLATLLPSTRSFMGDLFWNAAGLLAPFAFTFAVFLLAYRFLPNTRIRWRDILPGALLAAIGFEALKNVFAWYAQNYAKYNAIYGSVGSIIALLTFFYLSAIVLLFCAELAYQIPRMPKRPAELKGPELGRYRHYLTVPITAARNLSQHRGARASEQNKKTGDGKR
ncbi:MAG: YihY/virulence factor BrkB family protein [Chloroflexi bacterium]|nr:YihY/virulence factor BrkB family protein [Chloroflexota bacterium]